MEKKCSAAMLGMRIPIYSVEAENAALDYIYTGYRSERICFTKS